MTAVLASGIPVDRRMLIVIGASTGGTEALRDVLSALPADLPPVAITQHMPPGFTRSFAERLDKQCALHVKEAVDGERMLPGHAYIAPGDSHLAIRTSTFGYTTQLLNTEPVNRHRPSVEVLFLSAARLAGPGCVGVMLTGMGKDGAQAMLTLRQAGSYNMAQDEATSVVFGMPREAIALGAAHETVPLSQVAARIVAAVRHQYAALNNRHGSDMLLAQPGNVRGGQGD
ncbi:chemotaxis protein CheB [Pigmentiphaga aceris]|uniref:protein-glutamate methylesterase n=1 Tax=Pigmentiphaga aceris TaxID=1940612 RepID=A0A5C0AXV7_9BURK|nr:chemotaxis protein CheB [Pigmentiphaga aceris]